jgi:DNA-binding IscR family transcriptional regulator
LSAASWPSCPELAWSKLQLAKMAPAGWPGTPRDISLLEIYRAVEAPKAFAIHQYPIEKRCTVSCHIKSALGRVLNEAQQALEQGLSRISLAQVIADLHTQKITEPGARNERGLSIL